MAPVKGRDILGSSWTVCHVLEAVEMGRWKDLKNFDKGQIVIAGWLGQSSSKTPSLVGCFRYAVFSFDQVDGWVCMYHLPGEEMAVGWTMGRRQAGGGFWHSCGCYFDTYHLPEDCFRPLDVSGLFQQSNAPWYYAKMVKESFEEREKKSWRCWLCLQISQISIRLRICGMCWAANLIHGGINLQLAGLKGSVASV